MKRHRGQNIIQEKIMMKDITLRDAIDGVTLERTE